MKKALLFGALITTFYSFAQILNSNDFESWEDEHEYLKTSWEADGFSLSWVNGFNQQRCFVDNAQAHAGDKSLRVLYPAGGVGPGETGGQAALQFTPQDEVYMSYWMRFSDDFDWGGSNEGGKLPGFGSGENCSGGSSCDGTNGFSSRLMWRSGGKAVLYFYHMDKPATYGEDIDLLNPDQSNIVFEKGKWYQVAQRVKINTGNNYNGEVDVWINGEKALSLTGYRLVNNGDKVDNLYFSTFHGGSGSTWAPSNDCHIWYDDIIVSTNESDVFSSICKDVADTESIICPDETTTIGINIDPELYFISWKKDGEAIQGATEPTISIMDEGVYEPTWYNQNCTVKTATITVTTPELLSVMSDTICEVGNAMPSIIGNGEYTWFATTNDDNVLHSGEKYNVSISNSTTFYVEEGQLDQYKIGRSEQTGTTWNTTTFDASDKRTVLTNSVAVTLDAVTINSTNTDNLINLRILAENETTVLEEINFTVVNAGMNRVPVGIELQPGTYKFDLVGSSKGVHFETENSNYPLSIPGVLDLDCNVGYQCSNGWYGFFYDWEFSVGSVSECRTPVEAIIDSENPKCTITGLSNSIGNEGVYPNPTTGKVQLSFSSEYEVFDTLGNVLTSGNGNVLDLSGYNTGVYFVKINGEVHRIVKQ